VALALIWQPIIKKHTQKNMYTKDYTWRNSLTRFNPRRTRFCTF